LAAALAVGGLVGAASAATTTANLTINAAQTVRVVDNRVFGLNTAEWNGYNTSYGDTQVQALFEATNTGALRYPGGSTADAYHWQNDSTEGSKLVAGVSVPDPSQVFFDPSGTDFDQFAAFAKLVNAQPFITVNYGSGTAAEAAAWVQYSNVTPNKYGFKYWEVGNECYGLWEIDGNTPPQDPVEYATRFAQYYAAMKAMDPTIKIGAVASPGEDDYPPSIQDPPVINPNETPPNNKHYGWTPEVLVTLKSLGVTPDFLIYHRYEQNPGGENDAVLLQAASQGSLTSSPIYPWTWEIAKLRKQLTDYLPGAGANVEIDCTENNSVSTNPGKQSVSLVNGLYMADSIGSVLQTEVNAVIWWDSFNGQGTGGNMGTTLTPLYGWRMYGDYGIMNAGGSPYPTYYVHKLLGNFAQGGDTIIKAASDQLLLSVYAAKRQNGSVTLLVINKDPNNDWTGNIAISGYTPTSTAQVYSYGEPQDNAAQTNPGGPGTDVASTTMSVPGPTFSATFPKYSATVIALAAPQPSIAQGPSSESVNTGSTAVLTATGLNATSYQWSFNGTVLTDSPSGTTTDIISGSSGPQLVITNASAASSGSYTVVAVNSTGSSQPSSAATLTVAASSKPGFLVNISSRAFVGTGDSILIGGFFIGGSTSRSVLIQALGPALAGQSVSGTLPHPALTIHDSTGQTIYSNTGWGSNPVLLQAAASVYATPVLSPNSADSEVLLTLPPGGYTAEVADANGATGVALCAIYQLP
jgi:hypothetical protein